MKQWILPMLLGLAITAPAAEPPAKPKGGSTDVRKETGEAVEAVAAKAKQERDEFVAKAQQEMAELKSGLAELKQRAEKQSGKAKARIDRQIREMEPQLKAAEQKLADLKTATGEKWEELKTGVAGAIGRLKHALKKQENNHR